MNWWKAKKTIVVAVVGLLIFLLIALNTFLENKFINTFGKFNLSSYSIVNRLSDSWSVLTKKDIFICDIGKIGDTKKIILDEKNKALTAENIELREMVNFLSDNGYLHSEEDNFITTNIIGRDPVDISIFIVDVGVSSGIMVGMPVVVGGGVIVGKIIDTHDDFSHFIPITDDRIELSASINKEDKISGFISGSYSLSVKMSLIPIDKVINIGDTIVTSGMDKYIPPGLIIGSVSRVIRNDNDIFASAEILVSSSIDSVTMVTVLK